MSSSTTTTEPECPVCKDPTLPTHRECDCGGGATCCSDCTPTKVSFKRNEGVCMNHKQTVNGVFTNPTNTVARFASGGETRIKREGKNFAVVTCSQSFTGDWIEQFITDFEADLKDHWRWMQNSITDGFYATARTHKDRIKKIWKPLIDVYSLERLMRDTYEPNGIFEVELWTIYTLRQMMEYYWRSEMSGKFTYEHRRQLSSYCFDDLAVFYRLREIHNDDWLEDLWEEYGLKQLKKIRIPTKAKAVTPVTAAAAAATGTLPVGLQPPLVQCQACNSLFPANDEYRCPYCNYGR